MHSYGFTLKGPNKQKLTNSYQVEQIKDMRWAMYVARMGKDSGTGLGGEIGRTRLENLGVGGG